MLSVLLAIVFAHLAGATNVSWAAFAGYMVMRGLAAETLVRGLLRIVGTVIGGLLALVVTPLLVPKPLLVTAGLTLVGAGSLYPALTAKRAYAWLFLGLTFIMVLLDKFAHPAIALDRFVSTRIVETMQEALQWLRIIKAFGLEDEMRRRLGASVGAFEHESNKMARVANRAAPMMEIFAGFTVALS